jgi:ubiquitin carboxyl-terminal hydrolase 6/32
VINKPMVDTVDGFGRSDEEASTEAWSNHLLRNQSIVVELMHG